MPKTDHLSFTDSELLSPLLPPSGFDPQAGLVLVDRDLRLFFDTCLRGQSNTRGFVLTTVVP